VKIEVDVFGGEIRIVNCGKDFVLEEGRKDRAKGCEFVICVSAQMAHDEGSREEVLTEVALVPVERAPCRSCGRV
jgi:hypothetical protein